MPPGKAGQDHARYRQDPTRYRRVLVTLFFLGWALSYANRTALSPVLKLLGDEWRLDATSLGLFNSAFFLAYTLLQIPSGMIADRIGRRRVLLPGLFIQGVGAIASGLALGPTAFLAIRTATGLGQGTYYSTQYALAAEALPERSRGLGTAVINSGMAFGIIFGLWLAGTLVYGLGLPWRWPFAIVGLMTLALGLVMTAVVKEKIVAKEKAGVRDAVAAESRRVYLRTLTLTAVTALCAMYGFYVILSWLPYYLQTVRGVPGAAAANVATLMPLASVPGGLLVARLSDRIGKRRPVILALVPAAAIALVGIVSLPGLWATGAMLLLYGMSGKLVIDPLLVALVADVAPRQSYGAAFGILNFASATAMVLAPTVTGLIVDRTGSFEMAFYLAAGLLVVGWATMAAVRERGRA
jgi:MFS family permease